MKGLSGAELGKPLKKPILNMFQMLDLFGEDLENMEKCLMN